jgi:hypothetical protein
VSLDWNPRFDQEAFTRNSYLRTILNRGVERYDPPSAFYKNIIGPCADSVRQPKFIAVYDYMRDVRINSSSKVLWIWFRKSNIDAFVEVQLTRSAVVV